MPKLSRNSILFGDTSNSASDGLQAIVPQYSSPIIARPSVALSKVTLLGYPERSKPREAETQEESVSKKRAGSSIFILTDHDVEKG